MAGDDINSESAFAILGLPCVDCLEPYEPIGHEVVRADTGMYRLYAKCGGTAREPQ